MSSALKFVVVGCVLYYWIFCAAGGTLVEGFNGNEINGGCPEYASYYCACSKNDIAELTSVKMCLFPKSPDFTCIPCPAFLQDRVNCSKCPNRKCPICSLDKFCPGGCPGNKQSPRKPLFIKFVHDIEEVLRLAKPTDSQTRTLFDAVEDIEILEDDRSILTPILKAEKGGKSKITILEEKPGGSSQASSADGLKNRLEKSRFKEYEDVGESENSRRAKVNQSDVKLIVIETPTDKNRSEEKEIADGEKKSIQSSEYDEHQIPKAPKNSPSDEEPKQRRYPNNLGNRIFRFRYPDKFSKPPRKLLVTSSLNASNEVPYTRRNGIYVQIKADLNTIKSKDFKEELQQILLALNEMRGIHKKDDPLKSNERGMRYQNSSPYKRLSRSNGNRMSGYSRYYFNTNNRDPSRKPEEKDQNCSESLIRSSDKLQYVLGRKVSADGNKNNFLKEYVFGKESPENLERIQDATGNIGSSQAENSNDKSISFNLQERYSRVRRNSDNSKLKGSFVMRNSSMLQAGNIGQLGKSETFKVEGTFALGNSENSSSLSEKVVNGNAGKLQDAESRNSSPGGVVELRNSRIFQADDIRAAGNSGNSKAGDSFLQSDSEYPSLKVKDENVGLSQQDANKFITVSNDKSNSRNSSAEDSFVPGDSENPSFKDKDENVEKSQQDANKFVTDSSDKSNSRNSSIEGILEMRNPRPFQAGDIEVVNNFEIPKVEAPFSFGNSENPPLKEKDVNADKNVGKFQQDTISKLVTDSGNKSNYKNSSAEGIVEMRNSRTSQADAIDVANISEIFSVEDSFQDNSRNSSSEEKGNNENAGKFQQDADSKLVTDSGDQSNSKNLSAEDKIEMRNSRTTQVDKIGVAGNFENSTAGDSFVPGDSENPSLKEKDENVGKSQQAANKFATDSNEQSNSRNFSGEGILEMRNPRPFQAGDVGVVNNFKNPKVEASFAFGGSKNPPVGKKDITTIEDVGKFQQDEKFVTDSSDRSNSRISSAEGILEMRNPRTFQAGDIGVVDNFENPKVEASFAFGDSEDLSLKKTDVNTNENIGKFHQDAKLVADSSDKSKSRNSSAEGEIEMRNSRTSETVNIGVVSDFETSTVEVLVSNTPENSKDRKKDTNDKENAENHHKNVATKNDSRKFTGALRVKSNSKNSAADKNVSEINLGSFVEEGHRLHNDTSKAVAEMPVLRKLFQFNETKKGRRVIRFSVNDADLKSRRKRSLPHNDWCTIRTGVKHGNMECTIWTYKKECKLCCHKGYTFSGQNSMTFKCNRKQNAWDPKMCACKGSPQSDVTRPLAFPMKNDDVEGEDQIFPQKASSKEDEGKGEEFTRDYLYDESESEAPTEEPEYYGEESYEYEEDEGDENDDYY